MNCLCSTWRMVGKSRPGPHRTFLRGPHRRPFTAGCSSSVVKVLLDENFPLGLVRVLEAHGLHVDHILDVGWRLLDVAKIKVA